MTEEQTVALLTDDDRAALRSVLGKVPAIGLPHGGMGNGINPKTFGQVLDIIEHMGKAYGNALRENEALREQQRQHDKDLHAIRRVLGTAS